MFKSFPLVRRRLTAALAMLCMLTMGATMARAEGQLRIAGQYGITFLLLNIAQEQKLIEKHGKQLGVDIKVDWVTLSGGPAINDALLSGNIDIAGAGLGPLLTIWDRTRGRQNVRGVASLGSISIARLSL